MTGHAVTERQLRERLGRLSAERRAELADRIRRERPGADWFVRHGNGDPALRLFCLSYAGGGAAAFRSWPARLPGWVEVCAVQLPGREARLREAPYRRLRPLVTDLHAAVLPLLDRPFALFGHSMGALLAFELARQLRRAGAPPPERLLLAAFRAPQLPNPNMRIHHQPDEVLKVVLAKDGTPQHVLNNDEIMGVLLPTLRADLELCDTYEYVAEAPLSVPMSVFGGLHDVRVERADLERWDVQADTGISLSMFSGGHFFLRDAEDLLLKELTANLEAIRPPMETHRHE